MREDLLALEATNASLLSNLEAAQGRIKEIGEDADMLRGEMARAREAEQAAASEARTAYSNALAATQEAAAEAHRLVAASEAAHAAEVDHLRKVHSHSLTKSFISLFVGETVSTVVVWRICRELHKPTRGK